MKKQIVVKTSNLKKTISKGSSYVTIDQLNDGLSRLMTDISDLFYSKFEENDKRLEKLEAGQDKIINTQVAILGRLDDLDIDNSMGAEQIHETRKTLKDHEKRIKALETSKN